MRIQVLIGPTGFTPTKKYPDLRIRVEVGRLNM
jgi:hypothetical protein